MRKFQSALIILFVFVSFNVSVCRACASFVECTAPGFDKVMNKIFPAKPGAVAKPTPPAPTDAELQGSPLSCKDVPTYVDATNTVQPRPICVQCASANCSALKDAIELMVTGNGRSAMDSAPDKGLYAKCCR